MAKEVRSKGEKLEINLAPLIKEKTGSKSQEEQNKYEPDRARPDSGLLEKMIH